MNRREVHRLYEAAVQSPEVEIALFERVFRARFGEEPSSLREDFCGTAALCRHWVESGDERNARGVDNDGGLISLASVMNRDDLDEDEAARFELVAGDARDKSDRTFDVITAGNFSWALFADDALGVYLENARDCLADDGFLALEFFGGSDLRRPLRHVHPKKGFRYIWSQERFDTDTRGLDAAIHFELDDGRRLDDAFRYTFVVRSLDEMKEALTLAGFAKPTFYLDGEDGSFALAKTAPGTPIWGGYLFGFSR